jgi:hypothetical protein
MSSTTIPTQSPQAGVKLPSERRRVAAEAAARLVVAAIGDDKDDADDALAAPGVDVRLVAVELAAIAAEALRQAYGSDQSAYDAAARQLAQARGVMPAITWHRGSGNKGGKWSAQAGGETIATFYAADYHASGEYGRWTGEIYGEREYATTLRKFKALVAKAHAERGTGVMPAITWHRGVGNNSGFWWAEVGGETIAEVWVHGDYPVGDFMRYLGEIYGKAEYATTLRKFKALVTKAHAEREQA